MGMNSKTGKELSGYSHLEQSITDILSTPLGTRVMKREYGSKLHDYIDAPMTQGLTMEIFASIGESLEKWEPRFRLKKIETIKAGSGHLEITMTGLYLPGGKEIKMEGITI